MKRKGQCSKITKEVKVGSVVKKNEKRKRMDTSAAFRRLRPIIGGTICIFRKSSLMHSTSAKGRVSF